MNESRFFVSYASADREFAERLHDRLTGAGFDVWFDRTRLEPGTAWYREIKDASDTARAILAVITPRWARSPWTRFETYGAEHVVPILLEGDRDAVVPTPIRHWQHLDFRDGDEAPWDRLLARLESMRAAEPRPPKRRRFHGVPLTEGLFVGREEMLVRIHEALWPPPTPGHAQGRVVALTGLGGMGKTTAARHYAGKHWRLYDDVVWVDADTDDLAAPFAAHAAGLGVDGAANEAATAARVMQELARDVPRLLVFDNAREQSALFPWIPRGGACDTIITSRPATWPSWAERIQVGKLDRDAARRLLARRSGREDGEAMEEIARELDDLPLALEQAGAFMAKAKAYTPEEYLGRWREPDTRRSMLATRIRGSTEYPHAVAKTLAMTVDHLGAHAREILAIASFLAPDHIPHALFATDMGRTAALDAVAELEEYAVIDATEDEFSVHRLVQAVERDFMDEADRARWSRKRLRLLDAVMSGTDAESWSGRTRYARHVARMLDEESPPDGAAPIYTRTAIHLITHGSRLALAQAFQDAASALCRGDERARAGVLVLEAVRHWFDGAHGPAETAVQRAWTAFEGLDGEPDEAFVFCLNVRGLVANDLGRWQEAIARYDEAIRVGTDVLGDDHPLVGILRNNLGWCFKETGRYAEAEEQYRRRLAHELRRPNPTPMNVGNTYTNLATVCRKLDRVDEAAACIARTFRYLRRPGGRHRKYVALALAELGAIRLAQGRTRKARLALDRALAIQSDIFPGGHLDKAIALECLAETMRATGRPEDALRAVDEALAQRSRQPAAHPRVVALTALREALASERQ